MNEELLRDMGSEIKAAVVEIAKGLGVAAEHVYGVLVRQQITFGIALMVGGAIFTAAILWFMFKHAARWFKQGNSNQFEVGVLIVVLTAILTVVFIFAFLQGFMRVFNPEYYAMRDIVEMVQQLTGKDTTP